MMGATPPPKISPAPTTIPIADEISPGGADSVEIGPVISAILPRQQKLTRNNNAKSIGGFAPVFLSKYEHGRANEAEDRHHAPPKQVGETRYAELPDEPPEPQPRHDKAHLR